MVDLKGEVSVESSTSQASSEPIKSCTCCNTTTTPLWRGGPAGPKTLCNACGIKYHKKRRALLGLRSGKTEPKMKKKQKMQSGFSYSNGSDDEEEEERSPIRMPIKFKTPGRKLGEVEQAAVLLMALSSGSLCV